MKLSDLYATVDEIRTLENQLLDMCVSWENQDSDSGASDPGLQYQIEQEIESKMIQLAEDILENR